MRKPGHFKNTVENPRPWKENFRVHSSKYILWRKIIPVWSALVNMLLRCVQPPLWRLCILRAMVPNTFLWRKKFSWLARTGKHAVMAPQENLIFPPITGWRTVMMMIVWAVWWSQFWKKYPRNKFGQTTDLFVGNIFILSLIDNSFHPYNCWSGSEK